MRILNKDMVGKKKFMRIINKYIMVVEFLCMRILNKYMVGKILFMRIINKYIMVVEFLCMRILNKRIHEKNNTGTTF